MRGQPTHRQYALAEGRELPPAQVVQLVDSTRGEICRHPEAARDEYVSSSRCHGIEFRCRSCGELVVLTFPPTDALVVDFWTGGRLTTVTLGPAIAVR